MNKFLIAGLGNIGVTYEQTRHNIGFLVLDELANRFDKTFLIDKLALKSEFSYKGRKFILIKPSTYMNLSGKAIWYWMGKEKIALENLFVISDDIYLEKGHIKVKAKGGHAGHNGLRNIQEILKTSYYARMKIGIGGDFPKGAQAHYVLGEWDKEEKKQLNPIIEKATKGILSFGLIGIEKTMTLINSNP